MSSSVPPANTVVAASNIQSTPPAATIQGNGGKNVLTGTAGADVMDGGYDADKMSGGAGDDVYYVSSFLDEVENHGRRRTRHEQSS